MNNQSNQFDLQKRLIIAVLLSFGIMYVFSPPRRQRQASTVTTETKRSQPEAKPALQATDWSAPATSVPAKRPPAQGEQDIPEQEVVLEDDDRRITLSNYGAVIHSIVLKQYRADRSPESPSLELIGRKELQSMSVVLTVGNEVIPHNAPYRVVQASGESVDFERMEPSGLVVHRRYRLNTDFLIEHTLAVTTSRKGAIPAMIQARLALESLASREETKGIKIYQNVWQAESLVDGSVSRFDADHLKKGSEDRNGSIQWVGVGNKHFTLTYLPPADEAMTVKSRRREAINGSAVVRNEIIFPLTLKDGSFSLTGYLFAGPKELSKLRATDQVVGRRMRLAEAVDFGWFAIISVALLAILNTIHLLVGNYGVAILLLTLLIKVLFYPLTKKSFRSMKLMQQIQPLINDLKEKHKDNPQALQKAQMELFQRKGILQAQLSGCLPQLLQFPVYIALFYLLNNAVELRQQPFALWISDLSAAETIGHFPAVIPFIGGWPFGVMPLLYGVLMLVQTKTNPQTSLQPEQARMMMLMPLFFTVFFFIMPSGLVLYFLANTVVTVIQQYQVRHELSFVGLIRHHMKRRPAG